MVDARRPVCLVQVLLDETAAREGGDTLANNRRSNGAQFWTVILAAGAGRRLAGVTGGVPKQFWRANGRKSLLESTTDRMAPLAPPSRTVIVVDRTHRDHVTNTMDPARMGEVLFQPEDRGTGAGVLLALMPVLAADPNAIVTITPADHGVLDESEFRRGLLQATRHVRANGGLVLFGVEPSEPRADFGWITPGARTASPGFHPITSFVEKPAAAIAERLFATGAVWNTMVVVARASAVRALYSEFLPDLALVFDAARRFEEPERGMFLTASYPQLPRCDFSRDILTPARNLSTYVWPASVGWSDLGTPDRLEEWLRRRAVAHHRAAMSAA